MMPSLDDEDELLHSVALRNARSVHVARQRAEEALQKQSEWLRITLASIADAVISTDELGRVTYLNGVAEALTGWSQAEAMGRPLPEIFHIIDEGTRQPLENPALQAVRAGIIVGPTNQTILIARDGTERPVDDSAAPMRDACGIAVGAVLVFRDVTERKRAEAALREADHRKDEFLALLAHELRNPLAPLRNGLEVMRHGADDADAVAHARAMMERQLSHMVRLIDDLLDVSRVNRNKMKLRCARVLLEDVVNSALETARPLIDSAGHALVVSLPAEPVLLHADLTRLAQVFSNLLTNSAKYTERNGHIWLTAHRHDESVFVSVRDDGIGIPADSLPRIFDMFSQVDRSIERAAGGLGIGLALVKGLVEMHDGTVTAESAGPAQGTTFTVRLPVVENRLAHLTPEAPDRLTARRSPGRRILVVDDHHDSAASLAKLLELLGNEVHTAHDGVAAVESTNQFRPEVILMDVGMPRLNGYEATRRIRAQPWARTVVIVALTGWGQDGDRRMSSEAWCDGHLVKPVSLPDLDNLLTELIGSKSCHS
jgi:PAS domain S-box-containing protein